MYVDVHAHYTPIEYLDYLAEHGSPESGRGARVAPGAGLSIEGRLGLMDQVGIRLQVLSVGSSTPYLADQAHAVAAARLANDRYADLCGQYPTRFAAFGTVPLPHVDAALTEAARCLDDLHMLGITIGCSVAGRQLDAPAFAPFFAELDRRGTVLFLHPQGVGCGPGTGDFGMAWLVGAPVEDTAAALRLIMSGMLDRYPGVKIIVPHLGGVLPFLAQRVDDLTEHSVARQRAEDQAPAIHGAPGAYYRRLWYDTVNSHPAALRCARDTFGADRLLLGTDFPYLTGPQWAPLVRYVETAGFPPHETAAILGDNARALLGLPAA
ncbi:MAG TPA: amidohydrolase family protein [Chloroflexota bacterium]|nr:amidohydrolase family protein [Chloroflexota bacterium]